MKILFSHKLMGIVVSSQQASNIFWHSVTCLNAICVLISSLQRPWPLEKRGVRWFSLFHSPASSFLSVLLFLSVSLSLHRAPCPLLPFSLSFCSFLFHTLLQLYHWVLTEECFHQTKAVSIIFVPLSVIQLQCIDRSTGRQIGWLPVHPCISVPASWDSGVQRVSLLSF